MSSTQKTQNFLSRAYIKNLVYTFFGAWPLLLVHVGFDLGVHRHSKLHFFINMTMENGNLTWDNFVFRDVHKPVERAHWTEKISLLPLVFQD